MIIPSDIFYSFNWLGIDPGLQTCGVSSFIVENRILTRIEAFSIKNNQIRLNSQYPEEIHSERVIRINLLCQTYRQILEYYKPITVCCEGPFYNPRTPSAFGSLTETVTAIRLETHYHNPTTPFIVFSPQEVKQSFRRSGQKGKFEMLYGLLEQTNIISKLVTPIELLDDHAIDAIAVGYTLLKRQENQQLC